MATLPDPYNPPNFQTLQQQGLDKKDPTFTLGDVGGSQLDFTQSSYQPLNDAWTAYADFRKSQKAPLDIWGDLERQQNIPELRNTASSLQSAIANTEDVLKRADVDVQSRAGRSIMTEDQKQRALASYQEPYQKKYQEDTTNLGRVQNSITSGLQGIGQQVGLALQGQELLADPLKQKIQLESEQQARQITGFSADREMRLNILMDKIGRGRAIDDREKAEAFELLKMQKNFEYQKQLNDQQNSAALNLKKTPSITDLISAFSR